MKVVFVCWGNICRSPIAERVAQRAADEAGLTDVEFTSAGTSSEELGNPMDTRAATVLRGSGYTSDGHVAHRIDAAELADADLVIAMEDIHVDRLRRLAPDAENVFLLSEFDPDAEPGSGLLDPWYGPDSGFSDTLAAVEAAIPGVLDRVRELQQR
ncbi:MAG: low molecular weight protein-tyrosine-phosphatase [Propionibacteriaceae bacterium]